MPPVGQLCQWLVADRILKIKVIIATLSDALNLLILIANSRGYQVCRFQDSRAFHTRNFKPTIIGILLVVAKEDVPYMLLCEIARGCASILGNFMSLFVTLFS